MSITRRTMLTAAPAITLGGPALAQTQPPAQTSPAVGHQAPGYYRYKVGDIEVTAIHDGFARRPLEGLVRNADLNDIQKAMADAFLPTDALPITFTTLTLRTGGRFHPDHINGLRLKDGTAVFPNAEVMTPAPEWAFWMDDGRMAQAPEALKGNFQNVRRVFGPMACPSSDDLRLGVGFRSGGSGSSGLNIRPPARDAASGGGTGSVV
jgi:hypothetical protein